VLVRDSDGEFVEKPFDRDEDRRGVSEFGEDDEADGQERGRARDSRVNHREHTLGVAAHLAALDRVRHVGLTGRDGITDVIHKTS
jgi:hypothetical protein